MLASQAFDRLGENYRTDVIISSDHQTLDEASYQAYSPVYISAGLIVTYFSGFATLTAAMVHSVIHHSKMLKNGFKYSRVEEDDIHAKLMRKYPPASNWWFGAILAIGFALCIVLTACFNTGVPFWAMFLSLLIPAIFMLPFGFIYAMTGLQVSELLSVGRKESR